jgi:hypothetical protein
MNVVEQHIAQQMIEACRRKVLFLKTKSLGQSKTSPKHWARLCRGPLFRVLAALISDGQRTRLEYLGLCNHHRATTPRVWGMSD